VVNYEQVEYYSKNVEHARLMGDRYGEGNALGNLAACRKSVENRPEFCHHQHFLEVFIR